MKNLIIILIAFFSFNSFKNSEEKKHVLKKFTDDTNILTNEICEDSYCLKVNSFYDNRGVLDNKMLFKLGVDKQTLSFFVNKKCIKKINYPVNFITVKVEKNKTRRIQENVIYEISIIKNNKKWFYKVSGFGVMHNQSEFYGIYSPKGEMIWGNYTTNHNHKGDPFKIYGDINKFYKVNDFNDESLNKPFKKVEIKISN